jgi:hypothetical protein
MEPGISNFLIFCSCTKLRFETLTSVTMQSAVSRLLEDQLFRRNVEKHIADYQAQKTVLISGNSTLTEDFQYFENMT